jgi:hypothetical protein
MADEKYFLFPPPAKPKTMIEAWPELKQIMEFAACGDDEMRFVWHYANKTSPLYHVVPHNKKINDCFIASFGAATTLGEKKATYLSGAYPPHVEAAIKRMRLFLPDVRERADAITQKMLKRFEQAVGRYDDMEDGREFKDIAIDEQNAYVTMCIKINKDLPALVEQAESRYGVIRDKKDGDIDVDEFSLAMATYREPGS